MNGLSYLFNFNNAISEENNAQNVIIYQLWSGY